MIARYTLSHDVVSDYIKDGFGTETATLLPGHLSEHNNHPEIVRLVAGQALASPGLRPRLIVAEPGRKTEAFTF
jgi:hypothetical protein